MTDFIFELAEVGKPELDDFKTFDDDKILGKKCPDIGSLVYINAGEHAPPAAAQAAKAKAADDAAGVAAAEEAMKTQVVVLYMWAKFHKPGYRFMPLYSQLQAKYGDKVKFVAVSRDPKAADPTKFLEDPDKKYAKGEFKTELCVAHDTDKLLADALDELTDASTSAGHAYVVDATGTIVWHQDHSQIGVAAPSMMGLVERQIDLTLKGEKLISGGNRPEEAEAVEEECEVDIGGDGDDAFDFL